MSISELEYSVLSFMVSLIDVINDLDDSGLDLYLTLRTPIRECDLVRLLTYKAALDAAEDGDRT